MKPGQKFDYYGQIVEIASAPRWVTGGQVVDVKWTRDGNAYSGTVCARELRAIKEAL